VDVLRRIVRRAARRQTRGRWILTAAADGAEPRSQGRAVWDRESLVPRGCDRAALPVRSPPSSGSPAQAGSYRSRSGGCCATASIRLRCHDPAPLKKRGWPSPRRQQPVYQGPDASCRSPPSPPVRDRTSRWPSSSAAAFAEAALAGADAPRWPAGHRRRQALTDRDQVDDVPRQASASAATILPLPKNADGRPRAGSSLSTKGLMHPAARRLLLRSAIGRRDGHHPVRQALYESRPCGIDVTRRPDADRTGRAGGQRSLAERLLPARRWPSEFFAGEDTGRTARNSAEAQHPPDRDR